MIPLKLTVRNFMPYRDNVPPLNFAAIHTASICGDNGNGKSALIDAITWALWGKTRARNDDDLIHLGQAVMEVEFEFTVNEQKYRVIRKHAKPKSRKASGQSSLEFQIATSNGFRAITGNSIGETERKIKDTLHMDYSTFINSAYLRQGHADEFTIARPAERKQVLADILGLSQYSDLEEQSKERANRQANEKNRAETTIKDIDEELVRKPVWEAELAQAQGELSTLEKTLEQQEGRLNDLRRSKELLAAKRQELAQLEQNVSRTRRMLEPLTHQVAQHHTRIAEYEALIVQRTTIEANYVRLVETKKLSDELNHKLALLNRFSQRKHELDMIMERAQATLVTEHKLADTKISELEAAFQKLPQLKNEWQQAQAETRGLAEKEELLRQKRQESQQLHASIRTLEADNVRLKEEIKDIAEKLNLLLAHHDAKCPLCETVLGPDGLRLIETKYANDKQSKSAYLMSNQNEQTRQKSALSSLENETAQLELKLNHDRTAIQTRLGLLGREIAEAEKAGQQLEEERNKLSEIEERLARKDFATTEQEALHQIESELAKVDYNAYQHEEVRKQLASLDQYEKPKQRLEEADRLFSQERETASRAEQTINELQSSLEADKQKELELTAGLVSLPQLETDLAQAEAEHNLLAVRRRQGQESIGNIKGKLLRCTELETRKQEKAKLLEESAKEESLYHELARTFGKNGIQAWLIEMALPEIEIEANKLLSRMTDNRMHIKFETQKTSKTGGVIETLDISIADELGTRNYEMFSGGEAFRINFAIRIALSRLLAHRAGAPLPTLIIDEGFGTQDNTGLEKLKEAIISIQDDFEKIIVITHVEELRDAFPTRIEVVKTAAGSTFEMN